MKKRKILIVFGTRPEAIKMALLVQSLKNNPAFETRLCITGQHKEMLQQVMDIFDLTADYSLDVMQDKQTLSQVTSRILRRIDDVMADFQPDRVLVHGDTNTTFATALSAYYHRVPVGHVEAGLRTGNNYSPWPEEINRRLTGCITDLHFAPTQRAKNNLQAENIAEDKIYITGNTAVDAILWVSQKLSSDEHLQSQFKKRFSFLDPDKNLFLVTGHRRENFGDGMRNICEALQALAHRKDVQIVYPVHLNPNVKDIVNTMLSNEDSIYLIAPQDYLGFVYLMNKAKIILSDSGGIQEEAPSLNKPVLVMRDTTERPEAVESGVVKLVGTNKDEIIKQANLLLDDQEYFDKIALSDNPFGDGTTTQQICDILENEF